MASSSSSSSSSIQPKHQVFLSFRGEDTRLNFTSFLLQALKDKGIGVFFDEETLKTGEQLSQALLTAIAESQVAVVVLSDQYASSSFCLKELFEIMERSTKELLVVVPIFYHIDPSHVRNLGGNFKISFHEHQRKKQPAQDIQRWKDAFAKVGHLKGFHIKGGQFDRSEHSYIKEIIEDVIEKLNSKSSIASGELVGIDYQKEEILKLIHQKDTRVIGICGMGGIGKTTLAKAVYKEVSRHQFVDQSFFLLNVRENFEKNRMDSVVDDFLRGVLKQETKINIPLSDVIIDRLRNKRVFVVLDDVNDSEQIEDLGVQHLGPGSKIIVTSRDRQVLRNIDAIIYELRSLNEDDSAKLFRISAFKKDRPVAELWDLSVKLAKCARGLPLALKLMGARLYRQPKEEWESLMVKLKEFPEGDVFKRLKLSFDGLDHLERNVFLDIACFFKGYSREDATNKLDCCYNKSARSAITKLVDRCLVEISTDTLRGRGFNSDALWMHDSLQEMGWEIVRLESEDPRKRSRLWRLEEVRLLEDDKVTDAVKAIFLHLDVLSTVENYPIGRPPRPLELCPGAFEKMTNLQFIMFHGGMVDYGMEFKKLVLKNDLKFLSDELRFLQWNHYPLKSLPSNFNPRNLVELRLRYGKIELLWSEEKEHDLLNLRVLDVSGCRNLCKIPNLSRAMKLEVILCKECKNLVKLPSMEHLRSLKVLNLERCSKLKIFPEVPVHLNNLDLTGTGIKEVPDSIGHLRHLRKLYLEESAVENISSNLSKLESLTVLPLNFCGITEFPELPRNLLKLALQGTGIKEVPSSISRPDKLEYLDMSFTGVCNLPSSIVELHALKVVKLGSCPNLTIFPSFPEEIEEIDMMMTAIEEIPSSISRLKRLKRLSLQNSSRLKSLHELPPFIQEIVAYRCRSIQMVSFADPNQYTFWEENILGHWIEIESYNLNGDAMDNIAANALLRIHCIAKRLVEKSMVGLAMETEEKELDGKIYKIGDYEKRSLQCFIYGRQILEPFEHQSRNSSIILKLDPDQCSRHFLGFALGVLHDQSGVILTDSLCKWQLKTTSGDCHNFMVKMPLGGYNQGQLIYFDRIMVHEAIPYVEASFQFVTDLMVKKYGVHVFYTDVDRIGPNMQLSDGAECSETFINEEEDERLAKENDERNFSADNGREPEPNEMKTILCFPVEVLERLLQNLCFLFKGKVEQTEDASN
ncbi:hypothetical protein PTKIN_Ptkin15bG0186600 [Pterospermum kingtungense]